MAFYRGAFKYLQIWIFEAKMFYEKHLLLIENGAFLKVSQYIVLLGLHPEENKEGEKIFEWLVKNSHFMDFGK